MKNKAHTRLYIDPKTGCATPFNPRKKGDGSKARLSR